MIMVDATHDICRRDNRASVQRDFGQWDDGNEDAHDDSERLGVARRPENVGCDGIPNAVTKHEKANDSQAGIYHVLRNSLEAKSNEQRDRTYRECKCDIDGLPPLVRMPHVPVNLVER